MAVSPPAKQMKKGNNLGLGIGYCRNTSWRRCHLDSDMQFGFPNETGGRQTSLFIKREGELYQDFQRCFWGEDHSNVYYIWMTSILPHLMGTPAGHTETWTRLQSEPCKSLPFRYPDLSNFCSYLLRPLGISRETHEPQSRAGTAPESYQTFPSPV